MFCARDGLTCFQPLIKIIHREFIAFFRKRCVDFSLYSFGGSSWCVRKRTRTGIPVSAAIKSLSLLCVTFIVVLVKTVMWANWSSSIFFPLLLFPLPPLLFAISGFPPPLFLPSSFHSLLHSCNFFFVVTSQFLPASDAYELLHPWGVLLPVEPDSYSLAVAYHLLSHFIVNWSCCSLNRL